MSDPEAVNTARSYGKLLATLEADTHWRQFITSDGSLTDVRQVDTFPAQLAEQPWFSLLAGLSESDAEVISDNVRNTLQNEARAEHFGSRPPGESRLEAIFNLGAQAVAPASKKQAYSDLRDLKGMIKRWFDAPAAEPGIVDPLVERARSTLFSFGIDNNEGWLCDLALLGTPEAVMGYFDQRLQDRDIAPRPED